MEPTFRVHVLTGERTVLDEEVVSLQARGTEGFLGVLAHHAPLITTLAAGPLTLRYPDGRRQALELTGGVLEVRHNHAIVLADAIA
jgi:F-type H+-transporting ATPase subunit epsilon